MPDLQTAHRRTSGRLHPLPTLLLLLITPLAGACQERSDAPVTSRKGAGESTAPIQLRRAAGPDASFADIVDVVAPAVVTIRSERVVRMAETNPLADDPMFRRFFGVPQGGEGPVQRESGLGSGVIVRADGYILTNHHVVAGASEIVVELGDRRTFAATVVGSDPPSDLAVLKVDATQLPTLPFGSSDSVRVGDLVLAIGNPLGVGQTVTSGIISAKGRSTGLSDGSFESFLQTDAAINRGNSGGALVDMEGRLIGINSQILSPTGASVGIGFAIPSSMARDVMAQLIETGRVTRAALGVTIQPVTSDLAESFGLKENRGVIVNSVGSGTAAEKGGLRRGDVIIGFAGNEIVDPNQLRNRVASTRPGATVPLTIIREGRQQELRVTLDELKGSEGGREEEPTGRSEPTDRRLGLALQPMTPALAQRLGVDAATGGVVVTQVDPAGPAAASGLRPGDVIQQVNQQEVRTVADVVAARDAASGGPLLLLVNRGGQSYYVTVRGGE